MLDTMVSQVKHRLNATWRMTDKDGNPVKLFQDNALFRFLIKHNIVSPLFPKIPVLLGHWSYEKKVKNLVTNAGLAALAAKLTAYSAVADFAYIALGTGTVAAAATDTTLGTEITTGGLGRASGTSGLKTTTVTNDTATLTKTFASTGTFAVTESGVLNAASTGTLLCRQVFSAINLVSGNNLQIEWDIAMS